MERIVGIDVSKDQLDVAIRPGGARFVVGRTIAGVDDLILQLTGQDVQLIALEATGGFETVVAATLGSRIADRHRQSCADPCLCQGSRHQGQNRFYRCSGDCPFRRGDRTRAALAREWSNATACRSHCSPAADQSSDKAHPPQGQLHRKWTCRRGSKLPSRRRRIGGGCRGGSYHRACQRKDRVAQAHSPAGPLRMKTIAGVETVDHPSDAALVAYAKKYFKAEDRMLPQES